MGEVERRVKGKTALNPCIGSLSVPGVIQAMLLHITAAPYVRLLFQHLAAQSLRMVVPDKLSMKLLPGFVVLS